MGFILVVATLLGIIPGMIAHSKGHSFISWWIYGAALFIVALPHSLLLKPDVERMEREQLESGSSKKCTFCAEIIKAEARVCRFCGRDLPSGGGGGDSDDAITRRLVEALQKQDRKEGSL
jgi:hypothetical protein